MVTHGLNMLGKFQVMADLPSQIILLSIKNTVIVNYRDKRGKSREEFLFSKCVSDFCHDGLTTQIFISGKWVIGQ